MVSAKFIARIEEVDPILAQQFQENNHPKHCPVWNQDVLTETRTLLPEEAEALENWIHEP